MIVESSHFVVLERPISIWEPDGAATNLRFLQGLDPHYFAHLADLLESVAPEAGENSNQKDASRNAQTLRIALGMGLESLFALLAALVQAPHCIFGWLNVYMNKELDEVVRRISAGENVLALRPFKSPSWKTISEALLLPLKSAEPAAYHALSLEFAAAWKTLADVFRDELCRVEYNCMKHGFRVTSSAFQLKFSLPGESDKPFAEYDVPLGQTFPMLKKHSSKRDDYSVITGSVSLDPQFCAAALRVVAHSIHNAIQFSRAMGGDNLADLVPTWPHDDAIFRQLEQHSAPISSFKYGVNAVPDNYLSKEEILAFYK